MTITAQSTSIEVRKPAWLLIATFPVYAAYLALAIAAYTGRGETTATFTPADIDELGIAWIAVHILWIVPPVLAAVALMVLARQFGTGTTRLVPALAGVTFVMAAAYLIINALAYGFDGPTWGDSALYTWSNLTSIFAGWFGVHPATLIVVVALATAGIAKRTTIIVGVLYALYVVFELLTYLPVVFGSSTFADMTGGLPPFLLGVFWAVLGSGLLRARVPSGA